MAEQGAFGDAAEVSQWSLERVVGQLFSISVGHHSDGEYGFSDTREATGELVAEHHIGGVCYFPVGDDGTQPEVIAHHLAALQECASVPLLTSMDQEGGLVARMREPATRWPAAMAQLAAGGTGDGAFESIRAMAAMSGEELRAAGVNHVFAPVADVNLAARNPVIGIRSASSDPQAVAQFVEASVAGFADAGIASCLKHFPGHGSTVVDSHVGLPVLDTSLEAWRAAEALPFVAGIAAGVDAVMVGHLSAPGLDPSGSPATFSSAMVTELLRDELGFAGLIVTDALDMAGAQQAAHHPDDWGPGQACVMALQAGVDQLLMPRDPARCIQAVLAAVSEGTLDEQRLRTAAGRVMSLKRRLGLGEEAPSKNPCYREHQRRAAVALRRALTWRDPSTTMMLDPTQPVTVLHDEETGGTGRGVEDVPAQLVAALRDHGFKALQHAWDAAPNPDGTTVLVTRDAWRRPDARERIARLWADHGLDAVVCARSPYDSLVIPNDIPVLLSYGDLPGVAEAVADALIAGIALGTLPTDLPGAEAPSHISWPRRCGSIDDRVRIRPYEQRDYEALGHICVRTGDSGKDATGQFRNDELLPWLYAYPYVEYAPELCRVVEADGQVAGYVLGVADVRDFAGWWEAHWKQRFRAQFPHDEAWNTQELSLIERGLHPEHMIASWHAQHTAELHIDLLPVVQGMGLGRKLIRTFAALLRDRGVTGVTLGVGGRNQRAVAFYRSLGFQVLSEQKNADGDIVGYAMWLPTGEGARDGDAHTAH